MLSCVHRMVFSPPSTCLGVVADGVDGVEAERLLALQPVWSEVFAPPCPITVTVSPPAFSTPHPVRSPSSSAPAPWSPPLPTAAAGWAQNSRMSNDRHSRPTAQNDSLPASTVMGGKHVGPVF